MSEATGSYDSDAARDSMESQPEKTERFSFLRGLCRGATILGIMLTAFSYLAETNWVADLVINFRVQLAIGAAFIFLYLLFFKSWKFALLCLVGLIINGLPIVEYFSQPRGFPPEGGQSYRVLSLNVLTDNRNWQSVIDLIKSEDPDFVALMEVDSTWKQVMSAVETDYPFAKFEPRSDNFGIALLSKHPWTSIEVFDSESLNLPSIEANFDLITADPLVGVKGFQLIATHPIPPMSESRWRARNAQLAQAASRIKPSVPTMMVGDFNLTPWSPVFQRLEAAGLRDSALGFGVEPTWHIFPTVLGGLKLDHILISDEIEASAFRVGSEVGSDHRPIVLDFQISAVN